MSKSYRRSSRRGRAASAKVSRVVPPFVQPGGGAFAVTAEADETSYVLAVGEAEKCCQNVADVIFTADTEDNTTAHFQNIVNVHATEAKSGSIAVTVTATQTSPPHPRNQKETHEIP